MRLLYDLGDWFSLFDTHLVTGHESTLFVVDYTCRDDRSFPTLK